MKKSDLREIIREEIQSIMETDVAKKHQIAIAKKTLKMPSAMVGVMGGPNKKQAKAILKPKKVKESIKLGSLLEKIEVAPGEAKSDGGGWKAKNKNGVHRRYIGKDAQQKARAWAQDTQTQPTQRAKAKTQYWHGQKEKGHNTPVQYD